MTRKREIRKTTIPEKKPTVPFRSENTALHDLHSDLKSALMKKQLAHA